MAHVKKTFLPLIVRLLVFSRRKNSNFTILIHCDHALVYNDRLMFFIFLKKNLTLQKGYIR
jgi:hypothetical protein